MSFLWWFSDISQRLWRHKRSPKLQQKTVRKQRWATRHDTVRTASLPPPLPAQHRMPGGPKRHGSEWQRLVDSPRPDDGEEHRDVGQAASQARTGQAFAVNVHRYPRKWLRPPEFFWGGGRGQWGLASCWTAGGQASLVKVELCSGHALIWGVLISRTFSFRVAISCCVSGKGTACCRNPRHTPLW